jgi:hypothetical protein
MMLMLSDYKDRFLREILGAKKVTSGYFLPLVDVGFHSILLEYVEYDQASDEFVCVSKQRYCDQKGIFIA